jgi:hypothetical protein
MKIVNMTLGTNEMILLFVIPAIIAIIVLKFVFRYSKQKERSTRGKNKE